ncbi:sensor histidine kinase [Herbiconiux ginsengi]|uniref:histidine kinase n=1 Tax=Herbiconiux ginsengi TaxID=381665 RepID=A0A1H3KLD1_9MICO|nr:histidine kinase [Herbiconiux ginsengi]SDY53003.1 Signal transduction histidine kinase [Herbiconiux ginsengi]
MRPFTLIDPTTRRPTVLAWGALGVLAVVLASVSIPVNTAAYGVPPAASFVIGLLQAALIPLAAARPRLALVLSVIPLVLLPLLGLHSEGAPWPVAVTTLIIQAAVIVVIAFVSTWRVAIGSWLVSVLAVSVVLATTPERFGGFDTSLASAIPFAAVSGGLLAIALLLVQRRSIRAQLDRERQVAVAEQGRREVVEERNRIARELHDVVAHGMSVIQVQASSAKYRLPDLDPAVAAEFDDIGATARSALGEMRQLLGVLRNEEATTGLGPQPGLFDIPTLIDSARKTGVPVSLHWAVSGAGTPPAAVALAAYRIVQESLSNAVRHAPGAATRVAVTRSAAAVDISIENEAPREAARVEPPRAETRGPDGGLSPGSDASPGPGSGGHGLVGMRERTLLVGGTLENGPTDEGGYLVTAHLPLPATVSE